MLDFTPVWSVASDLTNEFSSFVARWVSYDWCVFLLAIPTVLWIVAYWLPIVWCLMRGPQNLKKKYNAKWALVTGVCLASLLQQALTDLPFVSTSIIGQCNPRLQPLQEARRGSEKASQKKSRAKGLAW